MSTERLLVTIDLTLAAAERLTALTSIIRGMRAEGRTALNDAEWAAVLVADDQADARLAEAIKTVRAGR